MESPNLLHATDFMVTDAPAHAKNEKTNFVLIILNYKLPSFLPVLWSQGAFFLPTDPITVWSDRLIVLVEIFIDPHARSVYKKITDKSCTSYCTRKPHWNKRITSIYLFDTARPYQSVFESQNSFGVKILVLNAGAIPVYTHTCEIKSVCVLWTPLPWRLWCNQIKFLQCSILTQDNGSVKGTDSHLYECGPYTFHSAEEVHK